MNRDNRESSAFYLGEDATEERIDTYLRYIGLTITIVRKDYIEVYEVPFELRDNWYEEGRKALCKAIVSFDPDKGAGMKTWTRIKIRGQLKTLKRRAEKDKILYTDNSAWFDNKVEAVGDYSNPFRAVSIEESISLLQWYVDSRLQPSQALVIRALFALGEFEYQLTPKEIAVVSGLAESTIRSHKQRALKTLRKEMEADGLCFRDFDPPSNVSNNFLVPLVPRDPRTKASTDGDNENTFMGKGGGLADAWADPHRESVGFTDHEDRFYADSAVEEEDKGDSKGKK